MCVCTVEVNLTDSQRILYHIILADISGSSTGRISLVVSRRTFVVDLAAGTDLL